MPRRLNKRLRRKEAKEALDIEITSLLDILVILLVFLLKSYSASGTLLSVAKGLEVPRSQSHSPHTTGVIVQISKEKMWVDEKVIYDFKDPSKYSRLYGKSKNLIIPLFNHLTQKRKEIQALEQSTNKATEFSGIVNLILEKTFRYSFLKKILNTCALAGFQQYKFIVMGEGEGGP